MSDMMMERSAVISECGLYRWLLTRTWDAALPVLVYIMLNPSKADGTVDDATIRICIGRAIRMGCGGIVVVNLFAYRATQPQDMLRATDPVGPENSDYIAGAVDSAPKMVIAAWGAGGNHMGRAKKVAEMCRALNVPLYCLGVTKDGHPKHPLRIAYAKEPEPWPTAPLITRADLDNERLL